jgi:hypothetical protein
MFVDSDGNKLAGVEVPESCIDSAEFIIRRIATEGARLSRNNTGPDMIATFANFTCNASTVDLMKLPNLPQNYDFKNLPDVGQGIILLSRSESDLTYNMHLGAIVAKNSDEALISHMFQVVKSPIHKPLIVLKISSVEDFADQTFGKASDLYAYGLLSPQK